jgi:hypothetical protein
MRAVCEADSVTLRVTTVVSWYWHKKYEQLLLGTISTSTCPGIAAVHPHPQAILKAGQVCNCSAQEQHQPHVYVINTPVKRWRMWDAAVGAAAAVVAKRSEQMPITACYHTSMACSPC